MLTTPGASRGSPPQYDRHPVTKDAIVQPGESQFLRLADLMEQLPGTAQSGGIRVSYQGQPGTLVIEGGLEDSNAGYSATMPMLSLNARRVRTLVSQAATTFAAVGVQIGKPAPAMHFPQGTRFTPYAWLRNLTAAPLRVIVGASYMANAPSKVELGAVLLAAKETRQVDMSALLAQAGLADYSGAANLTFTILGAGDSLLLATGSTSQDANYVFAVDPMILVPETGKIICAWQVEGTTDTMFSFWNSGSHAEDADLILFFPGGRYRLPLHLEANESTAVDMAELIHSGTPDADGNVIPANATLGSARLTNPQGRKPMDIKIGAGIFNVALATCWEPCPECDDIEYVLANPDPGATTPGGTVPFHSIATDKYGTQYDVTTLSTWSSLNTGIATVASTGVATGIAVGSATIKAHYQDTGVPWWNEGDLCQYPLPQCPVLVGNPTTPVNVAGIQITDADLETNTVDVTLTGSSMTGDLILTAVGSNNMYSTNMTNAGAGSYSLSFNRPNMPPDTYTRIEAQWNVGSGQSQPSSTLALSREWQVFGIIRHSQYNVIYESTCGGGNMTAYTFDSSCHFTTVSLNSTFVSQTELNGTGVSNNHGVLKYDDRSCSAHYPTGANHNNSLRPVNSITGSCNMTLMNNDTVATFPNPAVIGGTFVCQDDILLVTSGNANQAVKHVGDSCPACNSQFNGTNGHIDDYTSNHACQIHAINDYGNFWTADTQ